jgi:hypothetical protein
MFLLSWWRHFQQQKRHSLDPAAMECTANTIEVILYSRCVFDGYQIPFGSCRGHGSRSTAQWPRLEGKISTKEKATLSLNKITKYTYWCRCGKVRHIVSWAVVRVQSHGPAGRNSVYCLWITHQKACPHRRKPIVVSIGIYPNKPSFDRSAKEAVFLRRGISVPREKATTFNQVPLLPIFRCFDIECSDPRIQSLHSLQFTAAAVYRLHNAESIKFAKNFIPESLLLQYLAPNQHQSATNCRRCNPICNPSLSNPAASGIKR